MSDGAGVLCRAHRALLPPSFMLILCDCSINNGFEKLRLRLPLLSLEKKSSKVDILKHAIVYIKHLTSLIEVPDFDDHRAMPVDITRKPTLILPSSSGRSGVPKHLAMHE